MLLPQKNRVLTLAKQSSRMVRDVVKNKYLQSGTKIDNMGQVSSETNQILVNDSKEIAYRVMILQLGATGLLAGALLTHSTLFAFSAASGGMAIILANLAMTYFSLKQLRLGTVDQKPWMLVTGMVTKMIVLASVFYAAFRLYGVHWATTIISALFIQFIYIAGWAAMVGKKWR